MTKYSRIYGKKKCFSGSLDPPSTTNTSGYLSPFKGNHVLNTAFLVFVDIARNEPIIVPFEQL